MTYGRICLVPERRLIALHGPGGVAGGRKCTHVWGASIGYTAASSLCLPVRTIGPIRTGRIGRTTRCRTLPFGQQHVQQPRAVPRTQGFQQA